MSLVNKMLKDLEARQSVSVDGRSVFEGLQPARPATATTPRSARLFIWVSAGIFIVAAVGVTSLRQSATVSLPASTQVPPPVSAVAAVNPAVTVPLPPAVAPARQAVTEPPLHKRRTDTAKPMPAPAPHPKVAGTARIAKTERPYSAEERAEEGYREALSLRTQGNVAAAERALKALLAETPRHVKARELLASIQDQNGRWTEARATLEAGMALVSAHSAFRLQLARLMLEHGSEPEALAVLEAGRQADRADPELYAFLAALYQRAARHDEAVTAYRTALGGNDREGRWWVGLGISLEARQDSAGAREAYRRALASTRLPVNLAQYSEGRLQVLAPR